MKSSVTLSNRLINRLLSSGKLTKFRYNVFCLLCIILCCSILYFLFFFCGDRVAHYFYVSFCLFVPCCDVRYDLRIKTSFGTSLPPVVCRGVHVFFTLFVFAYVKWCPTHIVLCFCFVFLRLVYPMLPVSLDYLFWLPLRCSLTFTVTVWCNKGTLYI